MAAGSLNKVLLIGNLGKDPEMRYLPSGKPVTNFTIATSTRSRQDDDSFVERTEWHNIVCFDKTAETANQYLMKGKKVYVEGRIQNRSWDGNDGQKHYRTEIVASQVLFLSPPRERDEGQQAAPADALFDDADLPF